MDFLVLKSFSNYMDAHLLLSLLESKDINAWLRNENTATVMPIWNNALGGIQVMVRKEQYERACEVLQEAEATRKAAVRCPQCNSGNAEYINTMRKPVNWLSAAVTFVLGDYALLPEQRYHCFSCGHEWKKADDATEPSTDQD